MCKEILVPDDMLRSTIQSAQDETVLESTSLQRIPPESLCLKWKHFLKDNYKIQWRIISTQLVWNWQSILVPNIFSPEECYAIIFGPLCSIIGLLRNNLSAKIFKMVDTHSTADVICFGNIVSVHKSAVCLIQFCKQFLNVYIFQ